MFPSFLNLTSALIAAGIAIPALVLLYFLKLRRTPLVVGSTMLWRKSMQDHQVNAPFQRIRRDLLLLLQLLILLTVLVALARPISSGEPIAGQRSIILIDRSASMNATDGPDGITRLAAAKERASALVRTMRPGARAMVVSFDDSARIVEPFTSDTLALRRAIDSITPSDRPTNLRLAYELVDAQVQGDADSTTPAELHLFSDGNIADLDSVSTLARVRFHPVGSSGSSNVAITTFSARRSYDDPAELVVFAALTNHSETPRSGRVRLSVAPLESTFDPVRFDTHRDTDVRLAPAGWTLEQRLQAGGNFVPAVEFRLRLESAAVLRLEHDLTDDDVLASDNSTWLVVPPPRPIRLLLVSSGNPILNDLFQSLPVQKLDIITLEEFSDITAGDYDVMIFDGYAPPRLPASGRFIWIGAVPAGLRVTPRSDDAGVPTWDEWVGVLDWDRDHPITRGLTLSRVIARQALRLSLPPESRVLVEGVQTPLVVLHHQGGATHLLISFEIERSNWWSQMTIVPFMLQAVQFLAMGGEDGPTQAISPGQSALIPRSSLLAAGLGEGQVLRLIGPSGERRLAVPAAGDLALPPLERVGLYRTEPPVARFEHIAVNLTDPLESHLTRGSLTDLAAAVDDGSVAQTTATANRREWWWWLLLAGVAPLLILEWWVYSRRVRP